VLRAVLFAVDRHLAGPHPEPDGETVTIRYTLRELLDRLDELTDVQD
jgi:hypothetical protein